MTSLLSYLTLSDGFWDLGGVKSRIWTPEGSKYRYLGPPGVPRFGPIWAQIQTPYFPQIVVPGVPQIDPIWDPQMTRFQTPQWVKSRDLDPSESGFGQIWGIPFWERP